MRPLRRSDRSGRSHLWDRWLPLDLSGLLLRSDLLALSLLLDLWLLSGQLLPSDLSDPSHLWVPLRLSLLLDLWLLSGRLLPSDLSDPSRLWDRWVPSPLSGRLRPLDLSDPSHLWDLLGLLLRSGLSDLSGRLLLLHLSAPSLLWLRWDLWDRLRPLRRSVL